MPTPEELVKQAAALLVQAQELQTQLTRDDLKTMKPRDIVAARDNGRLDNLMKGNN